jgi:hypothetical protein
MLSSRIIRTKHFAWTVHLELLDVTKACGGESAAKPGITVKANDRFGVQSGKKLPRRYVEFPPFGYIGNHAVGWRFGGGIVVSVP